MNAFHSSRPATSDEREVVVPLATPNLLERIVAFRAVVGDGLNDEELTRLFRQESLSSENGFTFVSLCDGVATFSVPPQELEKWYPPKGWITPEKEAVAKSIAEKCGLSLCEPPDLGSTFRSPDCGVAVIHHHLEFLDGSESVVIAHVRYLKIRLFAVGTSRSLSFRRDFLEQLAGLYPT